MNIAIIGASPNKERMGNKAVRAYVEEGHQVFPVNPKETEVEGLKCYASVKDIEDTIDRVSMYVNPDIGIGLAEDIASVNPKELFINPGAESEGLIAKFKELGIQPVMACSIIDIGKDPKEM